jgi:Zn-dependent protease with chaperone function
MKSAVLALALSCSAALAAAEETPRVKVEGYAEWRDGDALIVDGQRVVMAPGGTFDGEGEAKRFDSVPLGYEVTASGTRRADGTLAATEARAQPNGIALFEKNVKTLTDQAEASYRRAGQFYQTSGKTRKSIGKLYDRGPEVDRMRRIVDRLVPPYVDREQPRVYVIDNKEWNAFAMGNYSIYAFSGILDDLDDDELAIVLGHELAHATHEHTRRQFKKTMWIQVAALGVTAAAKDIDDKRKRAVVQLLAGFTALAMRNGYGRDLEDQADRVGLRYAYEGGYDIRRGPALWERFAKKYGESSKAANFFFSNHSLARVRAANLERELAANYREGPKAAPAVAERPSSGARASTSASARAARRDSGGAEATRDGNGRREDDRTTDGDRPREIEVGMREYQVRRILGSPKDRVRFGRRTQWVYERLTVVFEDGRVKEVKF